MKGNTKQTKRNRKLILRLHADPEDELEMKDKHRL